MYYDSLICLQMLIILSTIGYNRFFYNKHLVFLGAFIFLVMVLSFYTEKYTFYLFIIYYLLILIFSYIRLNSLYLSSLFFFIQNSLLIYVWVTGFDFPSMFLSVSPVLTILPLILSIAIVRLINNRYQIWLKIINHSKSWTLWGLALLISNNLFLLVRQYLIVFLDDLSDYLYLSFFTLLYSIFVFTVAFYISKNYQNKTKIEQLIRKSQENSKLITQANEFQHDYKTFIFTTKRYLERRDFIGLSDYINSLENYSAPLLQYSLLSQIQNIKSPAIQGLLINLIEQCESKRIKLNLDIQPIPDNEFFSTIDFARCLSILLDNALEHTEGKIYVRIWHFNHISSCTIRNTYSKTFEFNKIFNKNYSTKRKHKGIGLSILKNIINSTRLTDITVENAEGWVSFTISNSAPIIKQ